MRITEDFVFFWSDKDYLSNFYPSSFIVDNHKYRCNEEYIMKKKALLFEDMDIFHKISLAKTPYEMKKLGRQVKNFDEDTWLQYRDDILYNGLLEKFLQNEEIKLLLLNTKNKQLVEASIYDKIYGVGLDENDDRILFPSNWKGLNLLGNTLMKVRDVLKY